MAEVKWIKITTTMFDDEKIKLIDAMPERDTIHYIWIRLLVQAGKTNANGYIYLSENIAYTDEMLATLFNRPLNTVRMALNVFKQFGMIEIDDNQLIYISNWDKHQNIEGMEKIKEQNRLRKQKQRERKKQIEAPVQEEVTGTNEENKCDCPVMSRDSHAIELEEELELDSSSSESFTEVYEKFKQCGFGDLPTIIKDKVASDVTEYSKEWVMKAAEVAAEKGKTRYDYIEGILTNWKKNGGIKLKEEPAVKKKSGSSFKKNNKFNSYSGQRKYDIPELEEEFTNIPEADELREKVITLGKQGLSEEEISEDLGVRLKLVKIFLNSE